MQELYGKHSKYKFWLEKVAFIGHVVYGKGVSFDLKDKNGNILAYVKVSLKGQKFSGDGILL